MTARQDVCPFIALHLTYCVIILSVYFWVAILIQVLKVCVYAGGQEEAEEAYEEAVNAIFVLQVQCHRHNQPRSLKIGKVRWEMIEMWPMQVRFFMTTLGKVLKASSLSSRGQKTILYMGYMPA